MRESTILVPDESGELVIYNISDLVNITVFHKASQGVTEVDPLQLAQELQERDLPVSAAQIARVLGEAGLHRASDGAFMIAPRSPFRS